MHNNAHNMWNTSPNIADRLNSNLDLHTFYEMCVLLIYGRNAAISDINRSTQHVMEQLAALVCLKLFMLQGCRVKNNGLLSKHLHALANNCTNLPKCSHIRALWQTSLQESIKMTRRLRTLCMTCCGGQAYCSNLYDLRQGKW